MAIQVETKDTTALSDAELAEMADVSADGEAGFDVGFLSKERESWVLVTEAHDGKRLVGFSLCTLERIGGTPCLLVGVASVDRVAKREAVLKAVMGDQYRRAFLAFPDEDVLVGARLRHPGAFAAFRGLQDVVPRPGHRASGEERAWGRRLAKRFGAEGRLDDRSFQLRGEGGLQGVLDYTPARPEDVAPDLGELFAGLDLERGDCLVAFGWAMAEDLAEGKLGR
jgi:hypothetical protein